MYKILLNKISLCYDFNNELCKLTKKFCDVANFANVSVHMHGVVHVIYMYDYN